jgi:ABC-2 type transport system permease protein
MNRVLVIARRELGSFFCSPVAYVAMSIFLLCTGFSFLDDFAPGQPAEMRHIFEFMVWLLIFIIPVLSMGLLAQEFASGTIETLLTAPVNEFEVVVGKFLGSIFFFLVLLAPTLLYVVLLRVWGQPDFGPILSGYLGIVLVGCLFTSVGLFCSSMTRSQVVAAALTALILFLVTVVPWYAGGKANLSGIGSLISDQAVYRRYSDFSKGVIDLGNVVFFLATTVVFLFLSVKVVESRRWK